MRDRGGRRPSCAICAFFAQTVVRCARIHAGWQGLWCFFSSRRRHTRCLSDWSSDVCSSDLVVDAGPGKVVASIANGTRVDALGWDAAKKLMFIPNGGEGNVTVVHQDSADKYTVVATVPTFAGAKTITVDPNTHNAYLFQPERGPAPAPAAGAPPAAPGGRGRGPQGPIVAAWFIVIEQ